MEPDLFSFERPAQRVLGSSSDNAGVPDSNSSNMARPSEDEVSAVLIKAWLPLKRQRKIMRSRSAIGQRTVKLLREKGDKVFVQVFRGKGGWSRGEWIDRRLTDLA